MSDAWRCGECGAGHDRLYTGPADTFHIAGRRFCCITTFARATRKEPR